MKTIAALSLSLIVLTPTLRAIDDEILHLSKLQGPALRLKVLRDTPLNLTQASNTYMTYLPRGQTVEVLAIARYQLQVRGRMRTGAVQGWVNRHDIAEIPDETISELQDKLKSQQEIQDAIRRKEVIFGMTQEQVRSILGRPTDKSRIQDQDGTTEIWTYYSYKSVPVMETFGYGTNAYTQVVTQKIRTGSNTISFKNGMVTRIEQKSEQVGGVQEPVIYGPGMPIVIPKGSSY
jgi:hypothetical protein